MSFEKSLDLEDEYVSDFAIDNDNTMGTMTADSFENEDKTSRDDNLYNNDPYDDDNVYDRSEFVVGDKYTGGSWGGCSELNFSYIFVGLLTIGVILMLVSLLMPSKSRWRYHSRRYNKKCKKSYGTRFNNVLISPDYFDYDKYGTHYINW